MYDTSTERRDMQHWSHWLTDISSEFYYANVKREELKEKERVLLENANNKVYIFSAIFSFTLIDQCVHLNESDQCVTVLASYLSEF